MIYQKKNKQISMLKNKKYLYITGLIIVLFTSCTDFYDFDCTSQNILTSKTENASASLFLDEDAKTSTPCPSHQIKCFLSSSKHPCERLGLIFAGGNTYASFNDCVEVAKQKAGEVGADFIVLEDNGVNEVSCLDITITKPWANFTVWIYCNP